MNSFFNEKTVTKLISNELQTSLSQNQIQELHYLVVTSRVTDYDEIKKLAIKIKNFLTLNHQPLKHSFILNLLSKSYGLTNHHDMSAKYKALEQPYENESQLAKLFSIREEVIAYLNKNFLEFIVEYQRYKQDTFCISYNLKPSDKTIWTVLNKEHDKKEERLIDGLNKILQKYKIKTEQNSFSFFDSQEIDTISYKIVKEYHGFFKPRWVKKNWHTLANFTWNFCSYTNVSRNRDLILVDSYSTDITSDVIVDFLNFLIYFGNTNDLVFLQKILENPTLEIERKHSFANELKIIQYNSFKFKKEFLRAYRLSWDKNLYEILDEITMTLKISRTIAKILEETHQNMKEISEFLNQACVHFYNKENRYEAIQKKLYCQLFSCKENEEILYFMDNHHSKENILITFLAQCIENTILEIKELSIKNNLAITLT